MMSSTGERDLVLTRILKAPVASLWRCWTEPALLEQWFCPKPWQVTDAVLDVRAGGTNAFTMRGPEGEVMPNSGVYLEVVPERRLVVTDAYSVGWVPSEKPFFTGIITFEDLGDGTTRYVATARHWTVEDCRNHEAMGFHDGWGICADQLEALAQTL
ncbi:SRPBCC family protein [Zavarzinia sp. CC-PAN008]|uniref:SRPBCC family protein n=1 Tax=Zavarzinia sp. CC-PAN008 TaxID=3243332 RepID=UPI003F74A9DF